MKFLVYIKKNWYRIVSIMCISVIVILSCATFAVASMSSDDILESLGFGDFSMYIDDSDTLVHQIILNQLNMSDDEYTAYYFEVYYDFLLDDHWGLATGAGGMFDSTNNFNDAYLTSMGQQYEMFNTVTPFKWSAFVEYAKARRAYEISESGSFDSDSFVKEKDIEPIQISSKGLKNVYSDYATRYIPMPNEDQYILSWQNSKSNKYGTDSKLFAENVPVYEYTSGTWGGKRWNDVYVLLFFYNDDDSRGYFYGENYTHYYSSKEDDSTVMIHQDMYYLKDNSMKDEKSVVWDISTYPYLGCALLGQNMSLIGYTSSSGLFLGWNGTSNRTRLTYTNDYMIYSLDNVNVNLSALINYASANFTPATNTSDDWGYIVSNKPFVNMLNQTAIDFDKIPDNYVITISGDTIYNYPITNPDTGDSTNITNYVTNNYTIPEKEPSGGGDSGGSSGTVSGKIDVSGKIEIVSSGGGTGAKFDQDLSLNNYYDWMQEQSTGFTGFMKEYLSWLPEDIVIMLCAGLALVILARFLGR